MSSIDIEEIERIVEIKKEGQVLFALLIHEPSAGVLLSVHEVQVKENKNKKLMQSLLDTISKEQDETVKESLLTEYSNLEKNSMEISFEFIKCMVKNYAEIENQLKYVNINYLAAIVQNVQEEFSKTKDSKKKLVALSKKNFGQSNSEKQVI